MKRTTFVATVGLLPFAPLIPALAVAPGIKIGVLETGPLDAITDVAGVAVGQVTKIEGEAGPLVPGKGPVRTGLTVIIPNFEIWTNRVAAATYDLNGNGELTGAHWVDEAGFLETPIAFTDTLDVGRVDDGVIDWMIARWPKIGVRDDVPLPVVAECDDQGLNDIQGRHVHASDAVAALNAASGGSFERGNVGAGTGMRAFGFKAGIGTASRKASKSGETVGVLLNLNTGSRTELRIDGVPVGRILENEFRPVFPRRTSFKSAAGSNKAALHGSNQPALRDSLGFESGRAADGSVVVAIATDAPLISRQLRELCKRAVLGLARTGITSHVSSGDLLIAFSSTRIYPREAPPAALAEIDDSDRLDALFAATAEAAEAAVVDALLSARTMSGARGITFYALPESRLRDVLRDYRR